MLFSAYLISMPGEESGGRDKEAFMGGKMIVFGLVFLVSIGVPAAAQEESAETLLEQQRALAAESGQIVPNPPSQSVGDLGSIDGSQPYLFVAVDDIAEFAYAVDTGDNAFTQLFTGNDPWAAAMIPAGTPGDAVIFFTSGSQLYRWQSGAPVLCCDLTLAAANLTVVGAAYNPSAEQLLFSRNIANEAIYSLLVPGGVCPASCEVTLAIEYEDGDFDYGGLAFDAGNGFLYGTNDDAIPGPAGVYRIMPDGSGVLVTAYPAGETDIDGLAYGNGTLYLVTDEPGDIYVYDIMGGTWDPPLANPWTTSEIFSAGAFGTGLIPVELQSLSVE